MGQELVHQVKPRVDSERKGPQPDVILWTKAAWIQALVATSPPAKGATSLQQFLHDHHVAPYAVQLAVPFVDPHLTKAERAD